MFEKGHPPMGGRPKGSVDKKWKKLSYWIKLVENEWPKLKPSQRAFIAMDAFKALLKRAQFSSDDERFAAMGKAEELMKAAGEKNFSEVAPPQ